MNIWLKFQTVLQQFKNSARRSYSPYNISKSLAGIHLMATHPFRDLWHPSLVLLNSIKRCYLHSSKKRHEIKDQQLQMSTMQTFAASTASCSVWIQ